MDGFEDCVGVAVLHVSRTDAHTCRNQGVRLEQLESKGVKGDEERRGDGRGKEGVTA